MTQADSGQGQAEAKMPMAVQGADEPGAAQKLTQSADIPGPQQATQEMQMDVQQPPADKPMAAVPEGQPESWGLSALGEPHTYRDGPNLIVMVVANNVAALSSGTGGFAEQAANMKAQEMGLAGKPVIVGVTNPFPVDPETLKQTASASKGCKWGKRVTLTTRG